MNDHKVDSMAYALSAMSAQLRTAPSPDLSGVVRAFRQMRDSLNAMTRGFAEWSRKTNARMAELANDEVRVSGLEARMLVLGGMLGTHVEGDVDATVLLLMRDPAAVTGEHADRLLTARSRARLAAALLRGHASQTRTQAGPVAFHRHWPLGDVRVSKVDGAFTVST